MARTSRQQEIVDEFPGAEFDDSDIVEDITPVVEETEVEDMGVVEEPVAPPPPTPGEYSGGLATTETFFGQSVVSTGEVEDLGVQVIEQDTPTYEFAVVQDIGPVFYGPRLIELKKGRLYRGSPDIYEYLYTRKLLVGQ